MEFYDLHPLEIGDLDDNPRSYWQNKAGLVYLASATSDSLANGYYNDHGSVARRIMYQLLGIDPDTITNPQIYLINNGWKRVDDWQVTLNDN